MKNDYLTHFLLWGLCVWGTVGLGSAALWAEPFEITGRTLDEAGNPIPGAIVWMEDSDIAHIERRPETVSDVAGNFTLRGEGTLDPSKSCFAVSSDETHWGETMLPLVEGKKEIPAVEIRLEPARIITGAVTDSQGEPVPGATAGGYSSDGLGRRLTHSDSAGNFRFPHPANHALSAVFAFKRGVGFHYAATDEKRFAAEDSRERECRSNGPYAVRLEPFTPVDIRVVNEAGEPLVGVTVCPWWFMRPKPGREGETEDFYSNGLEFLFAASTSPDGVARLESVPESLRAFIRYTAYSPVPVAAVGSGMKRQYGFASSLWSQMTADSPQPTLTLPKEAVVVGTVRDAKGEPVPRSRISVKWHHGCGHGLVFTDERGDYRLKREAGQFLDLGVESRLGTAAGVFAFDVGDGSEEKRLDFQLGPGTRLHGRVLRPDGKPAEKFWILFDEKDPDPVGSSERSGEVSCPVGGCPVGVVIRQTDEEENRDLGPGEYQVILPAGRNYDIKAFVRGEALSFSRNDFTVSPDAADMTLNMTLTDNDS